MVRIQQIIPCVDTTTVLRQSGTDCIRKLPVIGYALIHELEPTNSNIYPIICDESGIHPYSGTVMDIRTSIKC